MHTGDERGRPQRAVIIGGGFAGLFAARALRRAAVKITLIDRAQHHLFQPLLYQCATGILSEGKIAAPLRDVLKRHHNIECVLAGFRNRFGAVLSWWLAFTRDLRRERAFTARQMGEIYAPAPDGASPGPETRMRPEAAARTSRS